jgi:hypothetical protein
MTKKRGGAKEKTVSKWNYDRCDAGSTRKGDTCYSDEGLIQIRDAWNKRHSDEKILTNDPRVIWSKLQYYMRNTCKRESCWLKQSFMKKNLSKALTDFTFAPKSPKEWKKKPNEWLTSVDILKVMKQFEKKNTTFEFIGPSPIDYDKHISYGECVWEELCKFNLENYIKRRINKIGIVFNTDPHDQEGSHWVALFININRRGIYYFDSYGERISKFINRFAKKVTTQGQRLGIKFEFIKNKIRHQYKTSECGMYCIYFIIQMMKDKQTFTEFTQTLIPDDKMLKLRRQLFNYI